VGNELLKGKSLIYSAIVKYGLKNFQIEILEYCATENAISREQYYLDLLKPKYNILTTAGSRLGHIHSEEARLRMSNSSKGRKFSFPSEAAPSLPPFGGCGEQRLKNYLVLRRKV
jgi:group I intron endonuclease